MSEQDKLNGKYMTGWEIIISTFLFAFVLAVTYLILFIGSVYG